MSPADKNQMDKSFLVLFFKKERLPFVPRGRAGFHAGEAQIGTARARPPRLHIANHSHLHYDGSP
jgi:hypothetical protein